MIRHVVMWNLAEEYKENREEVLLDIKNRLEGLKKRISVIIDISVGINVNEEDKDKRDIALFLDIENMEDLKTYAVHPEHLKELKELKGKLQDRVVIDYKVDKVI